MHCDCIGGWCAAGASVRWAVRIREYQTCLASPVQSVQCHQSSTTANNGSDTHPRCKSDGNNQKHFYFSGVEDLGCKIDKKWILQKDSNWHCIVIVLVSFYIQINRLNKLQGQKKHTVKVVLIDDIFILMPFLSFIINSDTDIFKSFITTTKSSQCVFIISFNSLWKLSSVTFKVSSQVSCIHGFLLKLDAYFRTWWVYE